MNLDLSVLIKAHTSLSFEIENSFCCSDFGASGASIVSAFKNVGAIHAFVVVTNKGEDLLVLNGESVSKRPKIDFVHCLPILFSQCDPVEMENGELVEFFDVLNLELDPGFSAVGRVFGIELNGEESAYFVSIFSAERARDKDALETISDTERYITETVSAVLFRHEGQNHKADLLRVQKERTVWLESLLWLNMASDELEKSSYDKFYSEALFQLTVLVKSDQCSIHRIGSDANNEIDLLETLSETSFSKSVKGLYEHGIEVKKNEFFDVDDHYRATIFSDDYDDVVIYPVYFGERLVMLVSLAKSEGCFEKNQKMFAGIFCQSIQKTLEKRRLLSSINKKNAKLEEEKREQAALIEKLHDAQDQLFQQEKMASIGQLAAGVAHEINNPVGYVNSNIGALEDYITDLCEATTFLVSLQSLEECPEIIRDKVKNAVENIDLDFIHEDSGLLVKESKEGILRVKQIVQDLKDFSHVDEAVWQLTDVTKGINSTLNIVSNELKYKAKIECDFEDIPPVECVASQINQVIMNLLVNAGHAIEESGTVTIKTRLHDENNISISVHDTGCGISEEHISKIFNPFFTTKPVGKGTGLGLSLSYSIIEKHGGKLQCSSTLGEGTCFEIILPLKQEGEMDNNILQVGA